VQPRGRFENECLLRLKLLNGGALWDQAVALGSQPRSLDFERIAPLGELVGVKCPCHVCRDHLLIIGLFGGNLGVEGSDLGVELRVVVVE
jgi:hypothetical protein